MIIVLLELLQLRLRILDHESFLRKPRHRRIALTWLLGMEKERFAMEPLELVAHPVDLLDVGEDHLGVYPPLLHHP